MKKSLIASVCLFIATVILASLTSYNASALDLTSNVQLQYSWSNDKMHCVTRYGYANITFNSNTCVLGTNTGLLQGNGISWIETRNVNVIAGDYYEIFVDLSASSGAQLHIPVFWNLQSSANYQFIDIKEISNANNLGSSADNEAYVSRYRIILKAINTNSSFPIQLGYSDYSTNMVYLAGDSSPDSVDVRITYINEYRANSGLSVSDIVSAINQSSVNSGIQSLNSTGLGIRSDLQDLQSTLDDINDNQGRVADVAEDEYNQTNEDREQASSDANGFAFNFSLPNPFSIFQVSDGCVSTPTIDSWLHLEGDWQSPHCPIIPANVRNTLTPIVTLIVSLASLMVVIRWVSSSNVGVSDDIGQGGYSNSLVAKVNADKMRRSK